MVHHVQNWLHEISIPVPVQGSSGRGKSTEMFVVPLPPKKGGLGHVSYLIFFLTLWQ